VNQTQIYLRHDRKGERARRILTRVHDDRFSRSPRARIQTARALVWLTIEAGRSICSSHTASAAIVCNGRKRPEALGSLRLRSDQRVVCTRVLRLCPEPAGLDGGIDRRNIQPLTAGTER
jgi:hypothetical protein